MNVGIESSLSTFVILEHVLSHVTRKLRDTSQLKSE